MSEDPRLLWKQAFLLPDPLRGWRHAESRIMGIPALARLLLVLKRAGVEEVILPADDRGVLQGCFESYDRRGGLPAIAWLETGREPTLQDDSPTLAIRWGNLPGVDTLTWFSDRCAGLSGCRPCVGMRDGRTVLASFSPAAGPAQSLFDKLRQTEEEMKEEDGTAGRGCAIVVPDRLFLAEVEKLTGAEGDRALLLTVGKPTDRWHVVWIRNSTFAGMRWLAARAVTPNQVTVAGFAVAVLACLVIASGGYLRGVAGGALLYGSWVLDCMDGTLARLTFSESASGRKLDTFLGHLTNLFTFGALIWAAYGEDSPWKAVLFGFVILGGIMVAHRVSREEQRTRPARASGAGAPKLTAFLDKINHRDYAVIVLALALVDGFKVFVWLSAIGVQVFWLTEMWLILSRTADTPSSQSNPSRLYP